MFTKEDLIPVFFLFADILMLTILVGSHMLAGLQNLSSFRARAIQLVAITAGCGKRCQAIRQDLPSSPLFRIKRDFATRPTSMQHRSLSNTYVVLHSVLPCSPFLRPDTQ